MKKNLLCFAALVIVGSVQSVSIQNQQASFNNNMRRSQQTSTRACSYAIQQFNKGGPADFKNIWGTKQIFTDPNFPANTDAIFWKDYPRPSPYSLQSYVPFISWSRPSSKSQGLSLYGTNGIGSFDITQGYVNDCFILAPAQAMAENKSRIDNIVLNDDYPAEGLIALKLFVKGKPEIITIDDQLPFMGSNPIYAQRSTDGDFWMPFIEKSFAKLMGNYESIGGGWQAESWRILNGAPTRFFTMSGINFDANTAWTTISNALSNGFLVGVDTSSNPPFGLVGGHAYTVISYHELKDIQGTIRQRLFRVRNPWGQDKYSGPWSDGDTSRWTSNYQSQVPFANANDGYFFIDPSTFVSTFNYFQVNYFRDSWNVNYYEKLNDDGSWNSYTFTLASNQDVFIGADFYNPRMYAPGCRASQASKGTYNLLRGSTVIDRYSFDDRLGYGWTQYTNMQAGTYTLQFQASWTSSDVRDYVISVYSADKIVIYDSNGRTSFDAPYDLVQELKEAIPVALRDLSTYTLENGGWYGIRRGNYDSPQNNKFFFQYFGPTAIYNLNVQVTFTSRDSTAVVSSNAISQIQTTKNSDGTTTHTHQCQIRPKSGINDCSYLVYRPDSAVGVNWNWRLISWSNA